MFSRAGFVRWAVLGSLVLAAGVGCVRRTVTIHTSPPGALVYLNDQEVGRSPVSTDFRWYGDYDVVVRKDGYEPLRTHDRLSPPWYQIPPVDFVAEVLYPGHLHDRHFLMYELQPEQISQRDRLLDRAHELRRRAAQPETE